MNLRVCAVVIAGYVLSALGGYLLGSIPTGFLLAKARGIDIRSFGSGNIGATNVFRTVGTPAGILVLLADILKGWLAVAVLARLLCDWFSPGAAHGHESFGIIAGVAAILGHNFTCWLWFKGGKGIATSAGVLLALVPWAFLIALGIWLLVFALTRYVSLSSIAAALVLPPVTWLTGGTATLTAVIAALAALAIYKHRSNIKRLLAGTESRVGKQASPAEEPLRRGP